MTFKASKLPNDLSIVTYSMPSLKSVAINVIVGVGSRYEEPDEEGITHFLEHMAFKGTKTRNSKKIAEEFDAIGGQFNAYTSKEHTVYYAKVLEEHVEKAVDIISDIILNSEYSEEEISKEFNVICQEIAQTQDNPDDLAFENLIAKAFLGQPLGKSILGTESSIKRYKTEHFKEYVNKHYNAKNIVISAAGRVEHEKFSKIIESRFGSLQPNEKIVTKKAIYYPGDSFAEKKELEQTTLFLAFNSSSYREIKEYYHTQILSLILGGGLSSRLFQVIREQSGLAYSVGSFNTSFSDNGVFSLYAGCSHEKAHDVLEKMGDEINKIRMEVKEEELSRAKDQIKSCIYMAEEKTAYKSEEIGKNYSLFGRFIGIDEVLEEISNTTCGDIMKVANSVFATKPCFSSVGAKADLVNYEKIKENLK